MAVNLPTDFISGEAISQAAEWLRKVLNRPGTVEEDWRAV